MWKFLPVVYLIFYTACCFKPVLLLRVIGVSCCPAVHAVPQYQYVLYSYSCSMICYIYFCYEYLICYLLSWFKYWWNILVLDFHQINTWFWGNICSEMFMFANLYLKMIVEEINNFYLNLRSFNILSIRVTYIILDFR